MNAQIAQIAALACHLNARCRGFAVEHLFPGNSTCRSCAFVRFVQMARQSSRIGDLAECIETPDEWIDALVRNGVSRGEILYSPRNFPLAVDRAQANFAGDGGDWWIAVDYRGRLHYWQPFWRIRDRSAPDRRNWRVQYDETDRGPPLGQPELSIANISEQLSSTLDSIEVFATEHQLNLTARFRKARQSLTADGEQLVAEHYYTDLAPVGSLSLPSRRLLACCEDAWVFDGMGSWNHDEGIGLEGDDSRSYRVLSDRLFDLVNRSICAAVNESGR